MRFIQNYLIISFFILFINLIPNILFCHPAQAEANNSAIIIMYHRFDETRYPSTNITLKQLESHITELSKQKYSVLPVKDIINTLKQGGNLPDRTIGITIDDGYRSVYTKAWPRFKKAGLPFTVFIATDPIDRGSTNYMNWDQIRALKKNGIEIGAHTSSHNHMPTSSSNRNLSELVNSNTRMLKEIGHIPILFAYPFGEMSIENQSQVNKTGYKFAFGQHSGVVNPSTNFKYIPRFALNETYGNIDRLRLVLNALPIPVVDITPEDPLIKNKNPPHFGFTINSSIKNINRLSCFSSIEGRLYVQQINRRIEIRMTKPFPKGRSRINCTMPGPQKRWRWLGHLFVVP